MGSLSPRSFRRATAFSLPLPLSSALVLLFDWCWRWRYFNCSAAAAFLLAHVCMYICPSVLLFELAVRKCEFLLLHSHRLFTSSTDTHTHTRKRSLPKRCMYYYNAQILTAKCSDLHFSLPACMYVCQCVCWSVCM